MSDGFAALYVSIVAGCNPDAAFRRLGINSTYGERKGKNSFTDQDMADILAMKQAGASYRTIAREYGSTDDMIYKRLKAYKARCSM